MEFTEATKVQEMLLKPKNDKPETERPALTLVKMNEKAKNERRRKVS
jgi:hypothetical protein